MNMIFHGWIILIVAATAWDMGMRALPLVAAVVGVIFILGGAANP